MSDLTPALRIPKGAEAQCCACGEFFTSDSGFDGHLARLNSPDTCYDPATLRKRNRAGEDLGPKYQLVDRANGPTWALAGAEEDWRK